MAVVYVVVLGSVSEFMANHFYTFGCICMFYRTMQRIAPWLLGKRDVVDSQHFM